MSCKHLAIEERCCIRKYYKDGLTYQIIAEMTGRSPGTISREINRNRSFMNVKPAYYPHTAQKKYLLRRAYCNMFFADPYCAWQKGSSENSNGLLRKFHPKCRNLSRISPTTLKKDPALINAGPRKVLNFCSPQFLWDIKLKSIALSLTNAI